jgi:hypothetical protein
VRKEEFGGFFDDFNDWKSICELKEPFYKWRINWKKQNVEMIVIEKQNFKKIYKRKSRF